MKSGVNLTLTVMGNSMTRSVRLLAHGFEAASVSNPNVDEGLEQVSSPLRDLYSATVSRRSSWL